MTRITNYKNLGQEGFEDVVANSQTILGGELIANSGGFLVKATGSTPNIVGIANHSITSASDNQTVAQAKLNYTRKDDELRFSLPIVGGTVANTDEGKYFNLDSNGSVDGTSKATDFATANTSTGVITRLQLRLVKYVDATNSIFAIPTII